MGFTFKNKEEFTELDVSKKCYYLARLYIRQDRKSTPTDMYKSRLFSCANYLKKQPEPILSVLYNYLSDKKHSGLMIWDIVPKAVLYDQERRRNEKKKPATMYEQFDKNMLDEILNEWERSEKK